MFQTKHLHVKTKKRKSGLNPWYVTGLCESLSSFTFSRTSRNIALYFAMKFREGDEGLVSAFRSFFEAGNIYRVTSAEEKLRPVLYYRITTIVSLMKIVEHFDAFPLRGEKSKRYAIWRDMVLLKNKYPRRKKLSRDDLQRLFSFAERLSSVRIRSNRISRDSPDQGKKI